MEKTVCELFAGVGGFRLGLERASKSWKTVWFSQWEPGKKKQWAHDCYTFHWPDIDENTGIDIALVDKSLIPKHNLLVGGFPCQDYSVARPLPGSTGITGKKGVLWWQIVETLKVHKTPFILLENVDRLLKSPAKQRGRDFGIMLACLNQLGYFVEWRVINAADYGAAQRRRRVFIFASHKKTKYYKQVEKVFYSENSMPIDHCFFSNIFPVSDYGKLTKETINTDNIVDISDNYSFNFENSGVMFESNILTCTITPKYEEPIPLLNIIQDDVDEKYYLKNNMEKWIHLKGSKKIQRTSKAGHKYLFSEGAIPFPDNLDKPARTMLTSESSLNRSTHVIKDPNTNRLRLLSPIEAERIQGFDDDWTNTGMPEKFRYFCMGNALVVPLITRMGKHLGKIFGSEIK